METHQNQLFSGPWRITWAVWSGTNRRDLKFLKFHLIRPTNGNYPSMTRLRTRVSMTICWLLRSVSYSIR